MAGYFQNLHPNPCRYASNGYFGSKFITVCVTGIKIKIYIKYIFCYNTLKNNTDFFYMSFIFDLL